MRRRSVVLLSATSAALVAGIIGCGTAEYTQPTGTLQPQCVAAQNPPKGFTQGTTDEGKPLPQGTIDRPDVSAATGAFPTELKINDVRVGAGPEVKPGDQVTVNYVGVACLTGKPFDSSYEREPVTFTLNEVIDGWKEGLVGMKVGGRRDLIIPGDKAYTDEKPPPAGSGIGKFEPLFFVVELIKTETPPPTTTTTAAPATTAAPGSTAPASETPSTTKAPEGSTTTTAAPASTTTAKP